jgi:hypothetical protein
MSSLCDSIQALVSPPPGLSFGCQKCPKCPQSTVPQIFAYNKPAHCLPAWLPGYLPACFSCPATHKPRGPGMRLRTVWKSSRYRLPSGGIRSFFLCLCLFFSHATSSQIFLGAGAKHRNEKIFLLIRPTLWASCVPTGPRSKLAHTAVFSIKNQP